MFHHFLLNYEKNKQTLNTAENKVAKAL